MSHSLYVGNLHYNVDERILADVFGRVGPITSIRVCRDSVTARSLLYGFLNFQRDSDAERALDTMNFVEIFGKQCRISWSIRDPSDRISGTNNVFIKNLPHTMDNKGLLDLFSQFGNVISSAVVTDNVPDVTTGEMVVVSRGIGYVHFETTEAAQNAVDQANGFVIDGAVLSVHHFIPKALRPSIVEHPTVLFVKNFPLVWTENDLVALFEGFGPLTSVQIFRRVDGSSKGSGSVAFQSREPAERAIQELSGASIPIADGNQLPLLVCGALSKEELRRRFRQQLEQAEDRTLFVAKFDDRSTGLELGESFARFSAVASARVIRRRIGAPFGFVVFRSVKGARVALREMRRLPRDAFGKCLVARMIQTKAEREAWHMQRGGALNQYQSRQFGQPFPPQGMEGIVGRGYMGGFGFPQLQAQSPVVLMAPGQHLVPHQQASTYDSTPPISAFAWAQQSQVGAGAPPVLRQPSFSERLVSADPTARRSILGDRLYPLVKARCPSVCGKITGMLLELDAGELLGLLDNPTALEDKVAEARAVLDSYNTQQSLSAVKSDAREERQPGDGDGGLADPSKAADKIHPETIHPSTHLSERKQPVGVGPMAEISQAMSGGG